MQNYYSTKTIQLMRLWISLTTISWLIACQAPIEKFNQVDHQGQPNSMMELLSIIDTLSQTRPDSSILLLRNTFTQLAAGSLDTTISQVNFLLGKAFYIKGLHDSARTYYYQAMTGFRVNQHHVGYIESAMGLIDVMESSGNFYDGLDSLDALKHLIDSLRLPSKLPQVYCSYGHFYYHLGQFEEATRAYQNALSTLDNSSPSKYSANAYLGLGNVSASLGDYDKAIEHQMKAQQIYSKLQLRGAFGSTLLNLGSYFYYRYSSNRELHAADLDSAERYVNTSIEVFTTIGDSMRLARSYNGLGVMLNNRGKLTKALQQFEIAYRINLNNGFQEGAIENMQNFGVVYKKLGRKEEALSWINLAIDSARTLGDRKKVHNALGDLAITYGHFGVWEKAFRTLESYMFLKDSLIGIQEREKINLLKEQFYSEQKDQKLIQQTLENEIKAEQIKKQDLTIALLGVSILAFIGLLIVINRNHQKTIIAKTKIELQKGKIEVLQKEIHHRVKTSLGLVSGILSDLEHDVKKRKISEPSELSQQIAVIEDRISRIGKLHLHLYRHKVTEIQGQSFIQEMIADIDSIYGEKLTVEYTVDAKLNLDLSRGLPLILIIDELITNSYRHAFEGRSKGAIHVAMTEDQDNIHLKVTDDGPGYSLNNDTHHSSGLTLIKDLAHQLEAKTSFQTLKPVSYEFFIPSIKDS